MWFCDSCRVGGQTDEEYSAHLKVCPEYAILRQEHLFPGCRSIAHFKDMHRGAHGWVFGKGESLDDFDMSLIDGPTFCVNESVLVVPNPCYFFALDSRPVDVITSRNAWPPKCRAVLTENCVQYAIDHGIPRECVVVAIRVDEIKDCIGDKRATGTIHGHDGTVSTAIDMAYFTGCKKVTCVGFDGKGGYAPSLKLEYPPTNYASYESFHQHVREACKLNGLELEFYGD